jgi:hypothetical protein
MDTTKEQLLEAVFSMWSRPRLYTEGHHEKLASILCRGRVKYLHHSPANRRRRQKGNPVPWGFNWATLFLGDISTGIWPFKLGESQIWKSVMWSLVQRDTDLRMTALTRTNSNCKTTDPSSHQRGRYIRAITANVQLENKISCRESQGLVAKTNWLVVNRQS